MNNAFINRYEMSVLQQVIDQYRDEIGPDRHNHEIYDEIDCIACLKKQIVRTIEIYVDQTERYSEIQS